jgi:hypothetical protein
MFSDEEDELINLPTVPDMDDHLKEVGLLVRRRCVVLAQPVLVQRALRLAAQQQLLLSPGGGGAGAGAGSGSGSGLSPHGHHGDGLGLGLQQNGVSSPSSQHGAKRKLDDAHTNGVAVGAGAGAGSGSDEPQAKRLKSEHSTGS